MLMPEERGTVVSISTPNVTLSIFDIVDLLFM